VNDNTFRNNWDDKDVELHWDKVANIYVQENKPGKALDVLYTTLKIAPGAVELHLRLAQTLLGKEFLDLEKAAAHFLLVCSKLPNLDRPWEQYGMVMFYRGRLLPAYDCLAKALNINPKNKMALALLKKIKAKLGLELLRPKEPKIILEFYPSGEPFKVIQLRSNFDNQYVSYGIAAEFYRNGRVKSLLDLENDKPVGTKYIWSKEGKPISGKNF